MRPNQTERIPVSPAMEKLHQQPPRQLLREDGTSDASDAQIVAVSTTDGGPVDAATAAKIADWVSRANAATPAQQEAARMQGLVGVFMEIGQELGDKWELEDLDALMPKFRPLADELRRYPSYRHLNANGSLQATKDAVLQAAKTREGRVQFAWSSLLVELNRATGGLADIFASVLLWVPMLQMANATKDDADAEQPEQ